jgi:hypothetical protein
LIIGLILILLILEFVYPVIKSMKNKKTTTTGQDKTEGNDSQVTVING